MNLEAFYRVAPFLADTSGRLLPPQKMISMKEVAQWKRCVEENGPVKGATMDNFYFLIKQSYGDN